MRRLGLKRITVDIFMKRCIVISMMIMTLASGCGKNVDASDIDNNTDSSVTSNESITTSSDEIENDTSVVDETTEITETIETTESLEEEKEEIPEEPSLSNIEGVDIDLTALSSTVVYGQVYNMMYYPEKFVGKTIRMEGMYSDYFDEAKDKHYYACIIMDATACCAQGVEFELTEDYVYPDEYPSEGDYCIVEGVFETYEEDGAEYCTLRNARLIQGS
jgi:hypothetical protein